MAEMIAQLLATDAARVKLSARDISRRKPSSYHATATQ